MFEKFKELFGGKKEVLPLLEDYGWLAVDIHSHLIPGIDDGSTDLETSLRMLEAYAKLGFKKIITSPHVVSDGYNNSSTTILAGRDKVIAAAKERYIDIKFDAIAEYYLDETIVPKIAAKDLLTFGNNYILVELSYQQKANNIFDLIYKLQVAGYKVVLAHPERYPFYYEKDFTSYQALKDRSVLFQLNIGSLSGKYGKPAKQIAERLIDENMIDFLGSDLHRLTQFDNLADCLQSKHLIKLMMSNKLLNKTLL
jgi:protein-tyrosine phosphatase